MSSCFPCAADGTAAPVALEDWSHWRYALAVLGVTPPWTQEEFEDFDEWLAIIIEETEAGYADDAMYLLPQTTPAIDYGPPFSEPGI